MLFKQYLQQAKTTRYFTHSLIVQTAACVDHKQLAFDYLKTIACEDHQLFCNQCELCNRINKDLYLDFLYFANPDGNLTKDEILLLQEKFCLPGNELVGIKLYVIANLELVSKPILNSLLKFIEEPPRNTYALFFTSNADLVLKTITSRSQIINITDTYNFNHADHQLNQILPMVFNDVLHYQNFIKENDLETVYDLAKSASQGCDPASEIAMINKLKDFDKVVFNIWLSCVIALAQPRHKIELLTIQQQLKLNINRKTLVFKILDILRG